VNINVVCFYLMFETANAQHKLRQSFRVMLKTSGGRGSSNFDSQAEHTGWQRRTDQISRMA
jgi:hypothetical protein